MAKQSLREFQSQLLERLKTVMHRDTASKLGFLVGGHHWLTDLTEINGVVTVSVVTPVPQAKPCFAGLAGIRGKIYGCPDLAVFLGIAQETGRGESCLLLTYPRFGINAALRAERTVGLRNPTQMTTVAIQPDEMARIKAHWCGVDGVEWTEISVERLVVSPQFPDAGA